MLSLKGEKEQAVQHSVVEDNDVQDAMDLNVSGPLCGQGTNVCPEDQSLARDFMPSNDMSRKGR